MTVGSCELVGKALKLQRPARSVAIPQVLGWAARLADIPVHRFVTDAEVMAETLFESYRYFRYDLLMVGVDNSLEAEALGAVLDYPLDDYPRVVGRVDPAELAARSLPDPERDGRLSVVVHACSLLHRQLHGQVPLVGKVTGPFTIAGQLLGLEQLLYLVVDAPEKFVELLELTTQVSILVGESLLAAGASGLVVLEPAGSPSVLPARLFPRYLKPCLEKIFKAYEGAGAAMRWLQITGPVQRILPYFRDLSVNLVGLDSVVSPQEAAELLPGVCFIGNIKPFLFISGPGERIRNEVQILRQLHSVPLILSSGCELPLESDPGCVTAFMEASRMEIGE